ncbi:MAG: 4Fe-4S binding protein [Phycisphaeraceae bacterium]
MRLAKPHITWRLWRRLTQLAALALFFWLFRQTELNDKPVSALSNLFFRLDPLIAASAMLAARSFIAGLLLSLIVIGVTLVFGRAFCGWFCPLGTLLDGLGPIVRFGLRWPRHRFSLRRSRRDGPKCSAPSQSGVTAAAVQSANATAAALSPRVRDLSSPLVFREHWYRPLRYVLLLAVLLAAAFGLPLVGYLDPFALLTRGLAVAIDPALADLSSQGSGWLYLHAPDWITAISEPVYAFLRAHLLPTRDTMLTGAGVSAGILAAIFLLERVERRFWCRNLCPLGAGLGLIARLAPVGRKPIRSCGGCGECASTCRMGAFDQKGKLQPEACTLCMDCVTDCQFGIASFIFANPFKRRKKPASLQPAGVDLSRRTLLAGCALGVALPALDRSARALGAAEATPQQLRPPGADAGDSFLDQCVRCGLCMKVCPTGGIHANLLHAGLAGMFAPHMNMRLGYCEYNCTLCGQVCPTDAIPLLDLATKQRTPIGIAVIDEERCIPWISAETCICCEEHCPVADKAIRFKTVRVAGPDGEMVEVQRPHIRPGVCIGCGICETQCPVEGVSAIRVRPRTADDPWHPDGDEGGQGLGRGGQGRGYGQGGGRRRAASGK